MTIKLKYIQKLRDRHGKERFYFRRKGMRPVTLPHPDSEEFMDAYYAAMKGGLPKLRKPRSVYASQSRSLSDVIGAYYESPEYRGIKSSTQEVYSRLLERIRSQPYAGEDMAFMEQRHVRYIVSTFEESPTTANRMLRLLGQMFQFAIRRGWLETDPTVGVKPIRVKSVGFTPWSDEDIEIYEKFHPIGTQPRLAMALLLYTGQRRSDVVQMKYRNVRGDLISVVQEKTSAKLMIPIHPRLKECIDAWEPSSSGHFLTSRGLGNSPYSAKAFSSVMSAWREAAGLPAGLSPHGLRKAAARRLAEAGCTPHQIAAITGHKTLSEVTRYTRDVRQVKLAREAIGKLGKC